MCVHDRRVHRSLLIFFLPFSKKKSSLFNEEDFFFCETRTHTTDDRIFFFAITSLIGRGRGEDDDDEEGGRKVINKRREPCVYIPAGCHGRPPDSISGAVRDCVCVLKHGGKEGGGERENKKETLGSRGIVLYAPYPVGFYPAPFVCTLTLLLLFFFFFLFFPLAGRVITTCPLADANECPI